MGYLQKTNPLAELMQGSLQYQREQCIVIREIPQHWHKFVLFDSPKMGPI